MNHEEKRLTPLFQTSRQLSVDSIRCDQQINQQSDCYACIPPFVNNHGECLYCPRSTTALSNNNIIGECTQISINGCSRIDSNQNCLNCFLGFSLVNSQCTRTTTCNLNQYLGIDNACHDCSEISNCQQCYSSKVCSVCQSGNNLNIANGSSSTPTIICSSSCPVGYAQNMNGYCMPCGFKCQSCSGNNNLTCDACMSGYELDTTYNDNNPTKKQICMKIGGNCPTNCSSCLSGSNICLACESKSFLNTNLTCDICSHLCTNCSNSTTCSTCLGQATLSSGICSINCASNQYIDENGNCHACPSNCITCSGREVCEDCSLTFIQIGGSCIQCPPGCSICSNEFECLSCLTGFTLNNSSCQSICAQSGQYSLDGVNCLPCPTGCSQCISSTCYACNSGYTLSSTSCQVQCSSGYYLNTVSNSCSQCKQNCQSCSNNSNCYWCNYGYNVSNNDCISICPSNQFLNASYQCQNCPISCSTCTSESNCSSCNSGYDLQTNNSCVSNSICGTNQFLNNSVCDNCPVECSVCTSLVNCSACTSGYNLQTNTCVLNPICSSNQFFNNTNCENCPIGCSNCTSLTNCSACISGYNLQSTSCIINSACASNQFLNGSICTDCLLECQTCTSLALCQSCNVGYNNLAGVCTQSNSTCLSNQYLNDNNICINCNTHCLSCTGSQMCQSCEVGYSLFYNDCLKSSVCGDGIIKFPQVENNTSLRYKECDDKDRNNGDGCNSQCLIEQGYDCTYNTSSQKSICTLLDSLNFYELDPQNSIFDNNPIVVVNLKLNYPLKQYTQLDLLTSLTQDISIVIDTISNDNYSYSLVSNLDWSEIVITFNITTNIKNKQMTLSITNDSFKRINNIKQNNEKCDFPNYVYISSEEVESSKQIAILIQALSYSILGSIPLVCIFGNFQVLFNSFDLFQFIIYYQFLDIRLPFNVTLFIDIMTLFKLNFNLDFLSILLNTSSLKESYVPSPFKSGKRSGVFLNNISDDLSSVIIMLAVHLLIKFIIKLTNDVPDQAQIQIQSKVKQLTIKANKYFQSKVCSWEYGWYIDAYWEMYLALATSSFLQLYEIQVYSIQSAVNVILSFIFLIIVILTPFIFYFIIYNRRQMLESSFIKYKWGMLYEGLVIFNNPKVHPIQLSLSKQQTIVSPIQKISKQQNKVKKIRNEVTNDFQTEILKLEKQAADSQIIVDENFNELSSFQVNNEKKEFNSQNFLFFNSINNSAPFQSPTPQISNKFQKGISFIDTSEQAGEKKIISIPIPQKDEDDFVLSFSNIKQSQKNKDASPFKSDKSLFNSNRSLSTPNQNFSKRISKYFYIGLYLRKAIFGIVIVFGYRLPCAQIVFINVLNALIAAYTFFSIPFLNKKENVKNILCEILMIIGQSSFIALINDDDDYKEEDRLKIGWIFVSASTFILFIQFIFIFKELIINLKEFFVQLRSKNKQTTNKKSESEIEVVNMEKEKDKEKDNPIDEEDEESKESQNARKDDNQSQDKNQIFESCISFDPKVLQKKTRRSQKTKKLSFFFSAIQNYDTITIKSQQRQSTDFKLQAISLDTKQSNNMI